ncbi:MAG: NAD-dependent epimerase/dehydratase family protein [Trueperaceae bacterium]
MLVSGAHGFIGSHLCERLLASGHEVRALVSPWGRAENLAAASRHPLLELVRADVALPGAVEGVCRGIEAVIHAAARLSDWGPAEPIMRTNVDGTRHLLEAAARSGARRFVLVSSVAVHTYSGFRDADTEATARDNLRLPYARSKIAAEDLVFAWAGEGVVVRPGLWPFGARDRQLRRVARALRQRRLPLLDDGSRVLNTAYVENLVQGLELASTKEGVRGRAFVIADGGAPTWREVLTHLATLIGAPPPVVGLSSRLATPAATAVEALWAVVAPGREPPLTGYRARLMRRDVHFSLLPARRDLGYEPKVSWREGLAASVDGDPVLRKIRDRPERRER